MYRCGRPVDPEFEPAERLFMRASPDQFDDRDRLLFSAIRVPNQSVNRERYSEPEWVRLPDPAWAAMSVAAIEVQELPEPWQRNTDVVFATNVVHDPLEENYSHSEIRIHKNGEYSENLRFSKGTKLKLRARIAERAVLLLPIVQDGEAE